MLLPELSGMFSNSECDVMLERFNVTHFCTSQFIIRLTVFIILQNNQQHLTQSTIATIKRQISSLLKYPKNKVETPLISSRVIKQIVLTEQISSCCSGSFFLARLVLLSTKFSNDVSIANPRSQKIRRQIKNRITRLLSKPRELLKLNLIILGVKLLIF